MTKQEKKQLDRREYMRVYAKDWRKKNPDKNAKIQEKYWARRLQRLAVAAGPGEAY